MYFIVDECVPRSAVGVLESLGHTASRVIEINALGRQATDGAIFRFAADTGATILTCNGDDFARLFDRSDRKATIIVVKSGPARIVLQDLRSFMKAHPEALVHDHEPRVWHVPSTRNSESRD